MKGALRVRNKAELSREESGVSHSWGALHNGVPLCRDTFTSRRKDPRRMRAAFQPNEALLDSNPSFEDSAMRKNTLLCRFAFVLTFAAAPLARAEGFCSQLDTILAAAPQFASLRGEPEGMQYDGAVVIETATQCKLRNKSDLDNNWQPINEKWSYECLWEKKPPEALPMLRDIVQACLGNRASFSEGSSLGRQFSNFTGGTFTAGDTSIVVDFNKDTNQLWLTVLPEGVSQ